MFSNRVKKIKGKEDKTERKGCGSSEEEAESKNPRDGQREN